MSVEVRMLNDVDGFLVEAAPFLLEDEARHNLILGIAGTIAGAPYLYPERRFWIADARGDVVGAALQTPPYNLVLARPRHDDVLEAIAGELPADLPGVVGAVPEVDTFAQPWTQRHGLECKIVHRQGVYALDRVQAVPRPAGRARPSSHADTPLLLRWMEAFGVEALHESEPAMNDLRRSVEYRLEAADAGFLIWEAEGDPVSLAGWGGPTPNGIRVGPVYTPPDLRGRGYATALVAELSALLLEQRRRFCFLYTDLANPTSNAIYERIGYVRVCESAQISFESVG
jgi:GNAT superfamily N-acetyltransferase